MTEMLTASDPAAALKQAIAALAASSNVCDQAKAGNIDEMRSLLAGRWRDRVELLAVRSRPEDRSLVIVLRIHARGRAYDPAAGAVPADQFVVAIALPHNFPLVMPEVCFLGPDVPWSAHVVHRHAPVPSSLSPEERAFIRRGHGHCCFIDHWRRDMTLAQVVWQLSRIITGKLHGERGNFNRAARDEAFENPERLPWGPALPYPEDPQGEPRDDAFGTNRDKDEEAIEWQ